MAVDAQAVLPRALEIGESLAGFPSETYARTKHELRAGTIERLRQEAADDPLLARWVSCMSSSVLTVMSSIVLAVPEPLSKTEPQDDDPGGMR